MPLEQPRNARVLATLSGRAAGRPALERYDAVPADAAYLGSGCHPDVVERLWEQLNPQLPGDCRHLVHGLPALVHPGGLILAIGLGTQYAIRLLPSDYAEAAAAGARSHSAPSVGAAADLRLSHGADWVFGAWLAQEPDWCRAVHDAASHDESRLCDPAAEPAPAPRDIVALAAQEALAREQQLEQQDAAGDREATLQLYHLRMNAAFRQKSWALLDQAGALLARAAAAGQPQAIAMSVAWPALRLQAERTFPKAGGGG